MSILDGTMMKFLKNIQSGFELAYVGNNKVTFTAESYGCRNKCSGSCEGDCYGSCDSTCFGGSQDYDDTCWGLK